MVDRSGALCVATLVFTALAILILPGASAIEEDFYGIEGRPVALHVDVDPGGPVDNWLWDFEGDGCFTWSSPSGPNTTHVYQTPGLYYPVLRATNDSGTVGTWIFIALIDPENEPPEVVLGFQYIEVLRGEVVSFTGTAIDDGEVVLYEWDLDGDGTFDWESTSTAATTWMYGKVGTFQAVLRATDDGGATGTATATVVVRNQPPTVHANDIETDETQVTLAVVATDPDGEVVSIEWDPGDGSENVTTTEGTLVHSYPELGVYTVGVTVTDDDGGTATTWFRVTRSVYWVLPVVTASASPEEVLICEPITFRVDVEAGSSPTYDIQWHLDDGNTSSEATLEHSYGQPGTYRVHVGVHDGREWVVSDDIEVRVLWTPNQPPVAVPSVEQWVRPGRNLRFSDGSYDPDGTIVLWQWDFDGDGTFDHTNTTDGNHTHVYPDAGIFTAVLRVTDNRGAVGVATVNIKVDDEAPDEEAVDDSMGAAVCCGVTVVVLTVVAYWAVRRSMVTPRRDGGPPEGPDGPAEGGEGEPPSEEGPAPPDD